MYTQFAQDLRLARKISGLTQEDCSILINSNRRHMSALEIGKCDPTLDELLALSVIYNKTFEDHFAERMTKARATVRAGMLNLPAQVANYQAFKARDSSLSRIEDRLLQERDAYGA